jgi:hypothetical protein
MSNSHHPWAIPPDLRKVIDEERPGLLSRIERDNAFRQQLEMINRENRPGLFLEWLANFLDAYDYVWTKQRWHMTSSKEAAEWSRTQAENVSWEQAAGFVETAIGFMLKAKNASPAPALEEKCAAAIKAMRPFIEAATTHHREQFGWWEELRKNYPDPPEPTDGSRRQRFAVAQSTWNKQHLGDPAYPIAAALAIAAFSHRKQLVRLDKAAGALSPDAVKMARHRWHRRRGR